MESRITIAENIARMRKERRFTQEHLATLIGVTKASVSKWETGQSCPDIELLPRIAALFDITVDELIGFEPQMSQREIRDTCERLRKAFAEGPFDDAHAQCQQLVRNYYACYPLLVQIAALYLNHLSLVANEGAFNALTDEAIGLCERVRGNSKSAADIELAEGVEAAFLLFTGKPQAVIDLLGESPQPDTGKELILSNAYSALGQPDKADAILQGTLFESVVLCLNRLTMMAALHVGNPEKLDEITDRTLHIIDAFGLDGTYINVGATYIALAATYATSGNTDKAIALLERFEHSCRKLEFPLRLHGDAFFDKLDDWIEASIPLGNAVPTDDALVRTNLLKAVTTHPALAPLADDPRFKRIVKNLEEIAR